MLILSDHNCNFFADNSYIHSAYDEKIKTTRDQFTTQPNIPVSDFVLLNSVDSVTFQF